MKRSELKELIRKNIIQELSESDADLKFDNFLAEKKKDEEKDIEITADETDTIEEPATDAPSPENPALSDADQEYLNSLEDLKNKAKEMGDKILETQINNIITYYTRQHVVKDGDTDDDKAKVERERLQTKDNTEESLMENYELRRLQRIAGLIK